MQMGDVMTVFPFFQVFWIVFSVSGGVTFYHKGAVDLLGLAFVGLGVAFLVQHGKLKRFRRRAGDGPEPGEVPGEERPVSPREDRVTIQDDHQVGSA